MRADVAIVGLGTAGSAAAAACAERGLDVIAIDSQPLDQAGAQWVNGVPAWAFDAAGVERPLHPELRASHAPFHLLAGWGPDRVSVTGILEVDMRLLTRRLQGLAELHGARLLPGVKVTGFDAHGLDTTAGRIEAPVLVDAAGLTGPNLLRSPRVDRADICVAAQEVRACRDRDQARMFFERHGARLGDVLCFTSVAGGYSIVNVRVDGDEVSILTGSIPALGVPSGRALMERFVAEHRWVGEHRFGGARAIPLRRPWSRIGHGHVAAIGDAAGQVHAAHGSGIAQQLLAARLLADALEEGRGAWGYNVAWQRRYGGVLAGADVFRRYSTTLGPSELRGLIRRGVMSPPMMRDALLQRPPRPDLVPLLRSLRGLARLPRVARGLVPVLARLQAVERHYARYPDDPAALPRWVKRLERLSGVAEG